MKLFLISLVAASVITSGCVVTYVRTPGAFGVRGALLYPFEAGSAKLTTTNGTWELNGYKTDGGAAIVGAAVEAAVKTAAKELKP